MNLNLSPETIEELEVLAKQNKISIEKVVEYLITFYYNNSVIDELTPEEEAGLQAAIEESETPGFKGYSEEEAGTLIQEMLAEYHKKHSQGVA